MTQKEKISKIIEALRLMTLRMKKIERWFYLQLQLMLYSYFKRGNPYFTYWETHRKKK